MYYYEDVAVGDAFEFGSYEVTEAEIVEFAERYDPQPMHLDADAIEDGPIASGWHTCAMCMRLLVDGFLSEAATLPAPAIEEIRFPRPVRSGDVLSVRLEVLETRPSESDPDRGVVRVSIEGLTEDGETVLSMESIVLFRRRSDE